MKSADNDFVASDLASPTHGDDAAKSSMQLSGVTSFERIAMAFYGDGSSAHGRLLAICAEPGMGRGDVISGLLEHGRRLGMRVLRRSLASASQEEASRVVTRMCRELSRVSDGSVVAFDDLPPSDEAHVERQARALRRLVGAGGSVLLTVVPEARQLLESLPECQVLWSYDLLAQGLSDVERSGFARDLRELTGGIPSLLRSLGSLPKKGQELVPPQAYYDALGDLVSYSVRGSLSDDELALRLAMLLLGHGDCDDLLEVVGDDDIDERLARLRSDAPLFGISPTLGRFRCVNADAPLSLAVCLPRLSSLCALMPSILSACVRRLVMLERFDRASAICRMMGRVEAADLVMEHGAEFIEVGDTSLVRRASDSLELMVGPGAADARAVRMALSAVSRRGAARFEEVSTDGLTQNGWSALMLYDARLILRGLPAASEGAPDPESALARRLRVHRSACDLLARGLPNAAMRVLISSPVDGRPGSVSRALIDLDFEVARLLIGDCGSADHKAVEGAMVLLCSPPVDGLSSYPAIVRVISAVMLDEACASAEAESLSARAERSGDTLAHLVALLAGCVCDIRQRSCARANVRSLLAAHVAEEAGFDYLSRVARLLGRVARFSLGDRVDDPCDDAVDDLASVQRLVMEAMTSEEEPLASGRVPREVPRDALWLLRLLSFGMGELSELLMNRMPPSWRRALLAMEGVEREGDRGGLGGDSRSALLLAERTPLGDPSVPIEVSLLGGYAVYVRGVRIPDWKLEHRNVKSMLEFLVLQHGASAKRFQLVEQVWPDCDYATGFSRAYQATSSLRSTINEIEPGLDPFVTSRTSKEISLDMGLVRCDVDAFRTIAREASDCGDPARALSLARQAERLYAGDLYTPPCDSTGFVAEMRHQLRDLYADAMVAGADAAHELGHERTAARMASDALLADDLREDAVVILVRALRSMGRVVEADKQYRLYRSRLLRAGGTKPSKVLANLMGESKILSESA